MKCADSSKFWGRGISALLIIALMITMLIIAGCKRKRADALDYSDKNLWVYNGDSEGSADEADCFLVCPTVYSSRNGNNNMQVTDFLTDVSFAGALNMEKEIYSATCRMYAPFYRQASLQAYKEDEASMKLYLDKAYEDVSDAFDYYLTNYNYGRPIVLAGFSQGADMCIRLIKSYADDNRFKGKLVACYAIGWRVTAEDVKVSGGALKMAQGEDDTGVIIAFDCEAENVDSSLIIPSGTKTYSINPLNWRTDSAPAGKELNKGACFTDYSAKITKEVVGFTGAYIDEERGALKVPDVNPDDYNVGRGLFGEGEYHIFDYQFFFRNLQENVAKRCQAFTS